MDSCCPVTSEFEPLPSDLAAAHAMIQAERTARLLAEADRIGCPSSCGGCPGRSGQCSGGSFQQRSADCPSEAWDREAAARTLWDALGAQGAAARSDGASARRPRSGRDRGRVGGRASCGRTQSVRSFHRKRPSRKPFPDNLPRERVVIAAPESCPCCGSVQLSKFGEDITETLEVDSAAVESHPDRAGEVPCRKCERLRSRRRRSM